MLKEALPGEQTSNGMTKGDTTRLRERKAYYMTGKKIEGEAKTELSNIQGQKEEGGKVMKGEKRNEGAIGEPG